MPTANTAITRPDRRGSGTGTGNIISNNIFAKCDTSGVVFLNPGNEADGNVYVGMPARSQGGWPSRKPWRETGMEG